LRDQILSLDRPTDSQVDQQPTSANSEQVQRVFAATIFFGSEDQLKKHLVVDWTRFHFFDKCAAAHFAEDF
jgi:hypothetical protein